MELQEHSHVVQQEGDGWLSQHEPLGAYEAFSQRSVKVLSSHYHDSIGPGLCV